MIPGYKVDKKILLLFLILLQSFVVVETGIWTYFALHEKVGISLRTVGILSLSAGIVLGGWSVLMLREVIRLAAREQEAEVYKVHLEENRELIDVLRSHRHDFLNHLQVIMGCIHLNRAENALNYINEVVDSLKNESLISNMEHPEVAALLFKKMHHAEQDGIRLVVRPESDLRGLDLPASVISRILGNLVDNAFYAVKGLPAEEDRTVEITFSEDSRRFIIKVCNSKPAIPPELQEKVFQKGFTTKGRNGSGLGLYIVKELTEKHGGTVELTSNEEKGTVFAICFPKNVQAPEVS
ncbi:signal transduction histidine kinase regulating citrate/malate metabolism [Thermincola ferriacetica]|uniref:histidine kinase n=1 Tax=Thermincola ferriacetica TaxID=281456 RepID=A0A0L6W0K5_9FIRM|nr:ATP-binding protein [Thermincola ferriacetica]KNZ69065.1 signal transduction histidine kinase regulating citrate/malate metabolism [Thermincola ferriacetica]